MKWRPVILVGCGGMLLLCIALPFIPYFWRVGQASVARQRWEQMGADDYTVIVGRYCFCPEVGEYQLTVQNGSVTTVERVGSALGSASGAPLVPADFSSLTVEAMLAHAETAARRSWDVPWFGLVSIDYDPTYGYVTHYTSDANGWFSLFTGYITDSGYSYTARDLQFTDP